MTRSIVDPARKRGRRVNINEYYMVLNIDVVFYSTNVKIGGYYISKYASREIFVSPKLGFVAVPFFGFRNCFRGRGRAALFKGSAFTHNTEQTVVFAPAKLPCPLLCSVSMQRKASQM